MKLIKKWIVTAKNEAIKTELEKAIFWDRLNTTAILLFIVLIAVDIIWH